MERKILVVSDVTGSTAEHVLRAALAQFGADDVAIERRPETDTSLKSLEETAVEVVSLATHLPYRRGPEEA